MMIHSPTAAALILGIVVLGHVSFTQPESRAVPRRPDVSVSRSFLMGFTPFPYDLSVEAVQDTYAFTAANSDLVCFHHDAGVPWPEALIGTHQYHPNLIASIEIEREQVRPHQSVYVSATCQTNARAGDLALYWGENDNMPLPEGWESRRLDDPEVIVAYTNWCRYLIDRLEPDYFAYAIEANGGFSGLSDPELLEFATLAWSVYSTLKFEYPDLPVFLTVQSSSTEVERAGLLDVTSLLLQMSDMVAVSQYPYLELRYAGWEVHGDPDEIPKTLLSDIVDLAPDKPFAISETGYIAEDMLVPEPLIFAPGEPAWQAEYVDGLLTEIQGYDAEFVVWFVSRDFDHLLDTFDLLGVPIDPSFYIWRDNGLLDGDGAPRPALTRWRRWLDRPYRP